MDTIGKLSLFVLFIWGVMLPTHCTGQELASREPTHVVVAGDSNLMKYAPIGSWDQFVDVPLPEPVDMILETPRYLDFDPVEQRVYWGDTDLRAIYSGNLDGSEIKPFKEGIDVHGLAVDSVNRRVYYAADDKYIESRNMDGTGYELIYNVDPGEIQAIVLDKINSRVYWSDNEDYSIGRVNTDGTNAMKVISYSSDVDALALFIDQKGERLYWYDNDDYTLQSSDLDGGDRIIHEEFSDGSYVNAIAVYKDQIIITMEDSGNVQVWNATFDANTTTPRPFADGEVEPGMVFGTPRGMCLFYKYDAPSPILGIKVGQTQIHRGGFIAVFNVPIKGEMAGWTLEINFPRQVFSLKFFDCDVEIQDKSQTKPGGQSRGTKYTLIPTPGSAIPSPGSKLSFKIDAKTFINRKGFPRGILADFYPTALT